MTNNAPNFGLIIVGDEIMSGKRADKHLPKAIELLAARGLPLAYADYVGDDPDRITATLARAFAAARESGDVVFAIVASSAFPGVFPPVLLAGRPLIDGGVVPADRVFLAGARSWDPGEEAFGIFTQHDGRFTVFVGGFPIFVDGQCVGSIGASGGNGEQDIATCEAGIAAFMKHIGKA